MISLACKISHCLSANHDPELRCVTMCYTWSAQLSANQKRVAFSCVLLLQFKGNLYMAKLSQNTVVFASHTNYDWYFPNYCKFYLIGSDFVFFGSEFDLSIQQDTLQASYSLLLFFLIIRCVYLLRSFKSMARLGEYLASVSCRLLACTVSTYG